MRPPHLPCTQRLLVILLMCFYSFSCFPTLKGLCGLAMILLLDHVRYCQLSGQHFWYFSVSRHEKKMIPMIRQMNTTKITLLSCVEEVTSKSSWLNIVKSVNTFQELLKYLFLYYRGSKVFPFLNCQLIHKKWV